MRVLAFDPGQTTGYSVGELDEEKGLMIVNPKQAKLDHAQLFALCVSLSPDWIVYESFEYRNKARAGLVLVSAEYIGVLKLYAAHYDVKQTKQTAATIGAGGRTGYFNNDRLRSEGLYLPGNPHAMDSLRHLLYWYQFGPGFKYYQVGYELMT